MTYNSIVVLLRSTSALDVRAFQHLKLMPSANYSSTIILFGVSAALSIGLSRTLAEMPIIFIIACVTWAVWSALVWLIGTGFMAQPGTQSTWGELLRPMAFAAAPAAGVMFMIVPLAGVIVGVVSLLWAFLATTVAIRQTLDYANTARALGVLLLAALVVGLTGFLIHRFVIFG